MTKQEPDHYSYRASKPDAKPQAQVPSQEKNGPLCTFTQDEDGLRPATESEERAIRSKPLRLNNDGKFATIKYPNF